PYHIKSNKGTFRNIWAVYILYMGEYGGMFGQGRRFIQIQEPGQDPPIATGIDNIFGGYLVQFPVFVLYGSRRSTIFIDIYPHNLVSERYIDPFFYDLIGQDLIKIGPWRLPGPIPAFGMFFTEVEFTDLIPFNKAGTEFLFETHRFQAFKKSHFLKMVHTPRQKTFPDNEPGKNTFFDHFYIFSLPL